MSSLLELPVDQIQNKMDDDLISSKEQYEVNYVSYHYDIPKEDVLLALKEVGVSRRKVYNYLRKKGYTINTKRYK